MGYRISEVQLKNYGVIEDFSSNQFANINLIIGENGMPENSIIDTSIRLYEQEIEEVL